MSEERIGEHYQPTIVFECTIISGKENYILFEFGVNSEAERLFGYSRQELFNIYRQKRKEILARIFEPTYWEKVINCEVKSMICGEGGFRLFTTCLNKWKSPIKVLLDTRYEDHLNSPEWRSPIKVLLDTRCEDIDQTLIHHDRMNFFFIPLPEVNDLK